MKVMLSSSHSINHGKSQFLIIVITSLQITGICENKSEHSSMPSKCCFPSTYPWKSNCQLQSLIKNKTDMYKLNLNAL